MQVVGPTVRAFGLCVDATMKGMCEPLSPALDMLLIPHIPDTVAKLAGLFRAMPDLASCPLTHCPCSWGSPKFQTHPCCHSVGSEPLCLPLSVLLLCCVSKVEYNV